MCRFMGVYWANISSEGVCEAVESADAYMFVGPTFNDYSTCAFSHLLSESKMVWVDQRRVTVAGKCTIPLGLDVIFVHQCYCSFEKSHLVMQASAPSAA